MSTSYIFIPLLAGRSRFFRNQFEVSYWEAVQQANIRGAARTPELALLSRCYTTHAHIRDDAGCMSEGTDMMSRSIIAAGGLALLLAACDSQAENQVEETATAIDEADEAQADLLESMEAGGPNEESAEIQADAIRERGEETKDDLEDAADEMDTTPQ